MSPLEAALLVAVTFVGVHWLVMRVAKRYENPRYQGIASASGRASFTSIPAWSTR